MRIVALLALALGAWPAAAETLAGRVIDDQSGIPLANVGLRVAKDGVRQIVADLETDSGGRFRTEEVPAGEYRIEISKSNYMPATVRLRVDAGAGPLLLRLVRFGAIAGRVSDAGGRNVPYARIAVMTKGPGGILRRFGAEFQVDGRGAYRVSNLPPGQYAIAVLYGALLTAAWTSGPSPRSGVGSGVLFYPTNQAPQWFPIAGGEEFSDTNFTIVAPELFRVSGTVQPAGRRYTVALAPVDRPELPVATQLATERPGSGERVFQFEGIPPGSYQLYTSEYSAASPAAPVADALFGRTRVEVWGDVEGIAVTAEKGRSATFILQPRSAAAVCPPTAVLALTPLDGRTGWQTGLLGLSRTVEVNFTKPQIVNDLAPGRYLAALSKLGDACFNASEVIDLNGEHAEPIGVTVGPAAALRGRLAAGDARPGDFLIVLVASEATDGAQPVLATSPDASSRFAFTGLRPGRYRIGAVSVVEGSRARWEDTARMVELDLAGGPATEIDLPVPAFQAEP